MSLLTGDWSQSEALKWQNGRVKPSADPPHFTTLDPQTALKDENVTSFSSLFKMDFFPVQQLNSAEKWTKKTSFCCFLMFDVCIFVPVLEINGVTCVRPWRRRTLELSNTLMVLTTRRRRASAAAASWDLTSDLNGSTNGSDLNVSVRSHSFNRNQLETVLKSKKS